MYFGHQRIALLNKDICTPRAVTNAKNEKLWQWESDAFGDVQPQVEHVKMPLRFAGQYVDEEVGLFYNYFRFYDPATGRYIENDPIDLQGGLNWYGYVGGSPLHAVDPYGLARQINIGLSTTLAFFLGSNLGINLTLSIPDNWKDWKCYQIALGGNGASMLGFGVYVGYGLNFGYSKTKGSLQSGFSHGIYRYNEVDVGWNFSAGATFQGKENINQNLTGGVFSYSGWEKDLNTAYSTSIAPSIPKIPSKYGQGYGLYDGFGANLVGSYTTPVFDECGECNQ